MARTFQPWVALLVVCGFSAFAGEQADKPHPEVAALVESWQELHARGTAFELRPAYQKLQARAARVAEKLGDDPAAAGAYLVLARCCEVLGEYPEKDAAFERYVELLAQRSNDQAAAALREEAERLIADRELYPATRVLQLMLRKFPEGPSAAWASYRLGTAYLWMGDEEKAIEALKRVVEQWPNDPIAVEATLRLARAYMAGEDPGEAVAVLEDFLKAHPKSKDRDAALFALGVAHQMCKDYYSAVATFLELARQAPDSPYAPAARAMVARLRASLIQRLAHRNRNG